jgi:hypothetical protein
MPKLTPAPTVEAAFAEQRAAIRALLVQATRDEIATRYQASLRLLLLKRNPEKYGSQALERVAEDLGLGPATLHRYSAVAEAWPGHDIHDVLARTGGSAAFSWSHLVLLTRAPSVAMRQELTDACIREGWSVRELGDRLQVLTAQTPSEGSAEDHGSLRATLEETIERATRATREMAALRETLEEHWDEDWSDHPLLPDAIATFEALLETVDAALAALRRASGVSETRLKVATAAGAGDGRSRR